MRHNKNIYIYIITVVSHNTHWIMLMAYYHGLRPWQCGMTKTHHTARVQHLYHVILSLYIMSPAQDASLVHPITWLHNPRVASPPFKTQPCSLLPDLCINITLEAYNLEFGVCPPHIITSRYAHRTCLPSQIGPIPFVTSQPAARRVM